MIERHLTLCANGRAILSGYASGLQLGYTHNTGVYRLGITLTDEWTDTTVRAFWHLPGQTEPLTALVTNGTLNVPALVTAQSGTGSLTFEGSNGTHTVTSASIPYTVLQNNGTDDPELPEPGTPAWQQFVSLVRKEAHPASLTQQERGLLLELFQNAAYASAAMQPSYDALKTLWSGTPDTPENPDQPDTPDTPTTIPVSSVTLSKTTLNLTVGGTATLTATVSPSNATNRTVTWSVSPSGYATVSGGTVQAVKAGSCTVTATAGGKSASCAVTVAAVAVSEDVPGETPVYKLPAEKTFVPANKEFIDTGVKLFETIDPKPDWTILFEADRSATAEAKGDTYVLMHCMEETTPWPGFVVHMVGNGMLQTNIYGGKSSMSLYDTLANRGRMAIRISGTTATRWQNASNQSNFTISNYNTAVTKSLLLGCYQQSDGTKGRFFDGTLYQCLVYHKALTDEQVTAWLGES